MTTEDANATGTPQPGASDGGKPSDGQATMPPLTFDAWIKDQPEEIKGILEDHTAALKRALEAERTSRKDLDKQLSALKKQYEKGTPERDQIERIQGQLAESQRKADFFDAANRAGVTNLRLAYLAAQDSGLLAEGRQIDASLFEALKQQVPQLFAAQTRQAQGNAGAGTGQQAQVFDMNAMIRRAAGRPQ